MLIICYFNISWVLEVAKIAIVNMTLHICMQRFVSFWSLQYGHGILYQVYGSLQVLYICTWYQVSYMYIRADVAALLV